MVHDPSSIILLMTVDVVVQPMKQHTLCAGNFERQWTVPFFLFFVVLGFSVSLCTQYTNDDWM